VAALQSYFRAATRMVAPGDVFAVAVDTGDGRREILSALYPCAMSTIAHLSPSQARPPNSSSSLSHTPHSVFQSSVNLRLSHWAALVDARALTESVRD
jgi:hypothetical protein